MDDMPPTSPYQTVPANDPPNPNQECGEGPLGPEPPPVESEDDYGWQQAAPALNIKPNGSGPRDYNFGSIGEWDAGDDTDPISPRGWLLGNTFCRGSVSSVQAAGGTGKTALRTVQALAMATGRRLTGEHVFQRCRVLILSFEDDKDELRRRVRAAMTHHEVSHGDVRGCLFLATPAAMGWKLAELRDGIAQKGDLPSKLEEVIRGLHIDVVILDPLMKAHAVDENSNTQMDLVAGILARIAADCNCAIDAPHHVSKGTAEPGNADKGRGGSSFKDGARLVYSLTTMTQEEAQTFGIAETERRLYVRMDSAKVNIAPPSGSATWFRLVAVNLGNGNDNDNYPHGDEVQTVEPWAPPDVWAGLSHIKLNEILTELDKGLPDGRRYSAHNQAGDTAAWRVIHAHAPEKTEAQARGFIRTWIKNGVLVVVSYYDPIRRKPAKGLRVEQTKRPT
jgi:hypothetical protein